MTSIRILFTLAWLAVASTASASPFTWSMTGTMASSSISIAAGTPLDVTFTLPEIAPQDTCSGSGQAFWFFSQPPINPFNPVPGPSMSMTAAGSHYGGNIVGLEVNTPPWACDPRWASETHASYLMRVSDFSIGGGYPYNLTLLWSAQGDAEQYPFAVPGSLEVQFSPCFYCLPVATAYLSTPVQRVSSFSLAADPPTPTPVPEPASLLLLGTGLALAARRARSVRT